MVPGFNHNIKHKGRVFHIQTEDSGAKNPHIITHLFVGGNILASKKTTYAEIVGQHEFENTVRSMMEEQHKQMLRNLINGVYDEAETGAVHHLDGPAPLNTDPSVQSPSTSMMAGQTAHPGRPADGVGTMVPIVPSFGAPQAQPAIPTVQEITAEQVRTDTIFGEDLISEKSLDEVILSYLAEDLADLD